MRYAVHDRDGRPLAMLGFSAAAWKIAPRDDFIGWTPETRERNLPLMVDNSLYLIMPWIWIPNLASHILSEVRRQLPQDWFTQYRVTPVLMRNPALLRDHLQGVRMDPCRNHAGTRAVRHKEGIRQTEKGRLALSTQKRLEKNTQSMTAGKAITPLPRRLPPVDHRPSGMISRRGRGGKITFCRPIYPTGFPGRSRDARDWRELRAGPRLSPSRPRTCRCCFRSDTRNAGR